MNTKRVINILHMLSFMCSKRWACSRDIVDHLAKIGDPSSLRVIQFRLTALAEAGVLERHPEDSGQNIRYRVKPGLTVNLENNHGQAHPI